ncbi:MAG TPA: glycosyltransferase [Planctomycetaceae bacterium]|nr:glycosyltransferase [Planctomycetaceae bacterium]
MRIVSVIHSLNGGGAERVMARLVSMLSDRGHDVTLITLDDGESDRHEVGPGVQRVHLNVMRNSENKLAGLIATATRVKALRAAMKRSRPDVVLSFCDVTNVLTLLASRFWSVPVVVSERSDPAAQVIAAPWAQLRPKLYRRAAAVVVLTDAAASTVSPWCRARPIVIPSAVDTPPSDLNNLIDTAGDFVAVGRLEREKGFDLLIDAFAKIASGDPQATLRIYGEGSLRQSLEDQRDRLGLNERIAMPGWMRPIWPVLRPGGVYVLSSRYEGFPSSLLEAMASGMACIAMDCPSGPAAIVRDGVDGVLVPTTDVDGLASAMSALRDDQSLRERLGGNAREVVTRFGWDAMVNRYEKVLENAVID